MAFLVLHFFILLPCILSQATPHIWQETIHFEGDPTPSVTSYVGLHNISSAAAYRMSVLCNGKNKDEAVFNCCAKAKCFANWFHYTKKRLRWGWKIHDAQYEWSRRRTMLEGTGKGSFLPLIDQLLNASTTSKRVLLFVQVGANVGATENDPIYPMLATHPFARGVLLEPAAVQFRELQYNYREAVQQNRVSLQNSALCSEDGQKEIVVAKPPPPLHATQSINENKNKNTNKIDSDALRLEPSPLYDFIYRSYRAQMGRVDMEKGDKKGDEQENEQENEQEREQGNEKGESIEKQLLSVEDFGSDSKTMRENITCVSELAPFLIPFYAAKRDDVQFKLPPPLPPLAWVLVVDAEGSDLLVVRKALSFGSDYVHVEGEGSSVLHTRIPLPTVILFESAWTGGGLSKVIGMLDARGYTCQLETMMDIVCVRPMYQENKEHPACCLLQSQCSNKCVDASLVNAHSTTATLKTAAVDAAAEVVATSGAAVNAEPTVKVDISVDNVLWSVFLRRDVHPLNTAVESCSILKIKLKQCNDVFAPILLQRWQEYYM